MALELEMGGNWVGWAVAVQDADGGTQFSIPVRNSDLVEG
jgi:hypothetical protein